MNIEQIYKLYSQSYLVDTDTRNIRKGSLFFALKGENFNGNKFAKDALKNGASYAIIDEEQFQTSNKFILVSNVLETLQKLANFHRNQLKIPIISLTGSNGKTTTKELINAVLSKKYKTVATKGNLNNHIGVPLTLLSMNLSTEIGIVEMGANHLKEIELLSSIAEPNFGYITNFGKAHLEGFGGVEGVIKGKSEMYNFLRKTNGKAFINSDDELQLKQSEGIESIKFNSEDIEFLEVNPFVKIQYKNQTIQSQLIGSYNFNNIAAAITIGNYFNVSLEAIKKAIENYIPTNNRSQIIEKNSNQILLDAYNANPSSMKVALENFNQLNSGSKIVFLGDMFELGETSIHEHLKIAELASSFNFNKVYLIGKAFSTTNVKNAFIYNSFESFKNSTDCKTISNSTILIKGSRGMALERILELF
ncbi:UDP-N-acetylmuramoyl-tripeptide--D-alanyl-D-alanine ligase [Lutibacter sp. TH_r2]|uniref:UDP-N-acetylmuramoyl-tripeptide--D-alanyl-D- alanine ligase n=1 Tax=Lutibacter sp. TH_r2 TaxID=3082083 RepID=UPI002954CF81|nr:UDP-N-acetylmuramoyl-tripeptide--D-alanyl-D-alanine ligase [Lutibacter sp. TH_r2]MDV7188571.1 UDP-N-acetylmuramoyl-tripeptide--D-alanyl-D-alanine ligase [Lutibacter sp. TH_r2]